MARPEQARAANPAALANAAIAADGACSTPAARHIAGAGSSAADWRADAALAAVPAVALSALLPPGCRAVLVAPHPDDEVLACGGLLQQLAESGGEALLVAVTDGEASHPGSSAWPPARLRQARPLESMQALQLLGSDAAVLRLGLADGAVAAAEAHLRQRLAALFKPGDVVITTWRHDGHPDHEACARACLAAAAMCGATLLEVPVWGWHWCRPGAAQMPLAGARKLALQAPQLQRKAAALACFASQLTADPSRAAAPVLPAAALERLLTPFELYLS